MTKINTLSLCIAMMLCGTVIAQEKKSLFSRVAPVGGEFAAGFRFGGASGISLKKYAKNNGSAFEVVTAFNVFNENESMRMNVLFEKLAPLTKNNRLNAIYGAGIGMKFAPYRLGVAGIFGLDWRMTDRINMQLDWQPTYLFIGDSEFYGLNAGYTIRYNF